MELPLKGKMTIFFSFLLYFNIIMLSEVFLSFSFPKDIRMMSTIEYGHLITQMNGHR